MPKFTFAFLHNKYLKFLVYFFKTWNLKLNININCLATPLLKIATKKYKIQKQFIQFSTFLNQFVLQFINEKLTVKINLRLIYSQTTLLFIQFYNFFKNYLKKPLITLTNKYTAHLFLILIFFAFTNQFPYLLLLWIMLLFEKIHYLRHVSTITKLKTILNLAFLFNKKHSFLRGLLLKIKGKIGGVGNIRKRVYVIRIGVTDTSDFRLVFNMNTQELITETGLIKFKLLFASQ